MAGPPGSPRRHSIEIDIRRQQIAQRYLRGEYQSQIARDLRITQQQVSMDLKTVRAQWLASSLRDFDALKSEQLAKIDAIEQAAWEGWIRSCQPREVTITEAIEGGGEGPRRKASVRKEGQAGDPRFLAEINKCIERRCKLLGLDAPDKTALTTPDGTEPWQGTVIMLPSKAPSLEEWEHDVAQLRVLPNAEA